MATVDDDTQKQLDTLGWVAVASSVTIRDGVPAIQITLCTDGDGKNCVLLYVYETQAFFPLG